MPRSGSPPKARGGAVASRAASTLAESRKATAIAVEQADCYSLSKEDLRGLLTARPELAQEITSLLMQRQEGLAAAREKLDEEAERRRARERHTDLLSRIRNYFAMR